MGKTAQGTVTVGDILDDYLLYLSDKPTYQAAESAIRLHLRPAWGGMSARALRRADIVALADRLGRQGKRRLAGYCTATVRTAFNRARADGRLPRQGVNPAADLRVFLGRRRKRVATTDELARLHTALSAMAAEGSAWPPAIALYRLLLLTGARPCELRLVRWGDLDWHRRVLRLQDHKTATLTGEDREIHLSTAAFELVTALPRSPGCPFILPGRLHGEAMQDPTSVWRRACARAGIEDLNPYDLRRTYASLALAGGWSLDTIGQALGHRSVETTRSYAWLQHQPAQDLADTVYAALPEGWAAEGPGIAGWPTGGRRISKRSSASRRGPRPNTAIAGGF